MPKRVRRYTNLPLPVVCILGFAVLLFLVDSRTSPSSAVINGTVISGGPAILILFVIATLVIATVVSILLYVQRQNENRLRAIGMINIISMSGIEFEKYVAFLLRKRGFSQVAVTREKGDFGADLIAYKDGIKYAIQAKRWKGAVGVDSVYQVLGGKDYYGCTSSMVITNSKFTYQAHQLVKKTRTTLIDGDTLAQWIIEVQKDLKLS